VLAYDSRRLAVAVALTPQVPPIAADRDGVLRVSGTRVTVDTIVEAFEEGASAEEIASQYPVVPLSDVYAVIAYYLHHKAEISTYLGSRYDAQAKVRSALRKESGARAVREILLARRSAGT
jgi:uncharacterized protein (DUF433 family)